MGAQANRARGGAGAGRLGAIRSVLGGRCPRCRTGRIFRGIVSMNPACRVCGLRFGREAGYFLAAMYVSYALGLPLFAALAAAVYLVAGGDRSLDWSLAVAFALFLPFVPAIFRYSRIIWIHLDAAIDPPPP